MKYFRDQAQNSEINTVLRGGGPLTGSVKASELGDDWRATSHLKSRPLINVNGLNFVQPDYSKLPTEDLAYNLKNYVEHKIPSGHFLTAVISNDLRGAVARADSVNIKHIVAIVRWLYWEVPSVAWGSKEAFENWIKGEVE
jgi:hypothetical protein